MSPARIPPSDGENPPAALTAAVLARDEEHHLGPCLDSLAWADARLVMVDARAPTLILAIAVARGARTIVREFTTFPAQRNAVLDLLAATQPTGWVLFVDADERTPPSLASEVRETIARAEGDGPVGYWIPRRNYIWGGWIRSGGWSPDYQLRLLKVGSARYDESRDVHELVELRGPAGYLGEPLLHYNYDRFDQFRAKQRFYAALEAQRLARQGRRARPHNLLLQPSREFWRRFVTLGGYRDGWRGLALALLLAWYTGVTYGLLARGAARSP